jgi:hypothetical protein
MKDLQSKLDAGAAECLAEKEKVYDFHEIVTIIKLFNPNITASRIVRTLQNRKLTVENEKLQYRISHLIRAVKEVEDSK